MYPKIKTKTKQSQTGKSVITINKATNKDDDDGDIDDNNYVAIQFLNKYNRKRTGVIPNVANDCVW